VTGPHVHADAGGGRRGRSGEQRLQAGRGAADEDGQQPVPKETKQKWFNCGGKRSSCRGGGDHDSNA
jgi:hypothetical protein